MTDQVIIVADHAEPCVACHFSTKIRINGKPSCYGWHRAPLVQPAPVQAAPAAGSDAVTNAKVGELRLLDALMLPEYAPTRWGKAPYWMPPQTDVLELVRVAASWSWSRPFNVGPVVVLDRSGAFISAASSVEVAHGKLERSGPTDWQGRPGFYKVIAYPWMEEHLPNPLGPAARPEDEVWISADRFKLLTDLHKVGRWPDAIAVDSATSEHKARLSKWATHVNQLRGAAIVNHGRDSEQYEAVKVGFSQAVTLMLGTRNPGQPRTWKCGVHRPDWAYAIQDLSACNLWRVANRCVRYGVLPVALRNTDELVVPAEALAGLVEEGIIRIDKTGVTLGTFKEKADEE